MFRFVSVLLLVPVVALAQPPASPPGVSNWPFDEIILKNGAKFQGLIVSESPTAIVFKSVRRPPGKPTVTLTSKFTRDELARIKPLNDADRAILKERLAELDPDGSFERHRMDALELTKVAWLDQPGAAKQYDSDYFTLVSSAPEEVMRRAAVRLEQIYTAFAQLLPGSEPMTEVRRTRIALAPSREEYRALLVAVGQADLLNPAVFDPKGNTILCGSNLGPLGDELQKAKFHHSQQLVSLVRYEEGVKKLYKKPEVDRYLDAVRLERRRIYLADRKNGEKFDEATQRLFALLYHEAFHAYASVVAYPPLALEVVKAGKGTGELPRWLNEGLAQIFETAVVEAGELRADHPDKGRLDEVRKRLRAKDGPGLMPLSDLLLSGRDAFLAHHADQRGAADRAYLTSWALAYYLTFDRRAIGTAAFKQYLAAINSGGDPRQAFEKLVGQDLAAFERDWHAFLLRIKN